MKVKTVNLWLTDGDLVDLVDLLRKGNHSIEFKVNMALQGKDDAYIMVYGIPEDVAQHMLDTPSIWALMETDN
jgi:hypothetical protein